MGKKDRSTKRRARKADYESDSDDAAAFEDKDIIEIRRADGTVELVKRPKQGVEDEDEPDEDKIASKVLSDPRFAESRKRTSERLSDIVKIATESSKNKSQSHVVFSNKGKDAAKIGGTADTVPCLYGNLVPVKNKKGKIIMKEMSDEEIAKYDTNNEMALCPCAKHKKQREFAVEVENFTTGLRSGKKRKYDEVFGVGRQLGVSTDGDRKAGGSAQGAKLLRKDFHNEAIGFSTERGI